MEITDYMSDDDGFSTPTMNVSFHSGYTYNGAPSPIHPELYVVDEKLINALEQQLPVTVVREILSYLDWFSSEMYYTIKISIEPKMSNYFRWACMLPYECDRDCISVYDETQNYYLSLSAYEYCQISTLMEYMDLIYKTPVLTDAVQREKNEIIDKTEVLYVESLFRNGYPAIDQPKITVAISNHSPDNMLLSCISRRIFVLTMFVHKYKCEIESNIQIHERNCMFPTAMRYVYPVQFRFHAERKQYTFSECLHVFNASYTKPQPGDTFG
jgi:hypothetical protein